MSKATRDQILPGSRWQLSAAWDIEFLGIKKMLESRANSSVGKVGATLDSALAAGKPLPQEIFAQYFVKEDVDPTLIALATGGDIERAAPSARFLRVMGTLRWAAMLAETLIFIWLWLSDYGNAVLIVIGLMLAGFGFLFGHGVGRLLIAHDERRLWADLRGWISVCLGFFGIAGLSAVRATGADAMGTFAVVTTTALLALIIAAFEALYSSGSVKYDDCVRKMFQCQSWFSNSKHEEASRSGLWEQIYEAAVRSSAGNLQNLGQ